MLNYLVAYGATALCPLGILLFAIAPTAWSGGLVSPADVPWSGAVSAGALFGFLAYATYDLSSLATLRGWPLRLALADTPWGAAFAADAAAAGRWGAGAHGIRPDKAPA